MKNKVYLAACLGFVGLVAAASSPLEISGDTVVNEDGNKMDVAVINIDGQSVAFIDVDMDNVADVYVMDANGDNMLEEEEFVPIRDYSLSMVPFRETVYPGENWMAQEDDYINDANVDDFMA